jgi:hypothetical protein
VVLEEGGYWNGVLAFGFVPELDGEKVGHFVICYFGGGNGILDIIVSTIEASISLVKFRLFQTDSPITTVPGYVAASSINLGPKVNEAGASSGDATE